MKPIEPPTKAVAAIKAALDVACEEVGLPVGELLPKTKHFRYRTTLPDGSQLTVSVPCTPRNLDLSVKEAKARLTNGLARILRARGRM